MPDIDMIDMYEFEMVLSGQEFSYFALMRGDDVMAFASDDPDAATAANYHPFDTSKMMNIRPMSKGERRDYFLVALMDKVCNVKYDQKGMH